jgi:formate hydrogenlyase subunit 6/NADH:ubiquinone oxidoreductase subunit I
MPKPVIDYKKCSACGACIDVCPVNVLVKENDN